MKPVRIMSIDITFIQTLVTVLGILALIFIIAYSIIETEEK